MSKPKSKNLFKLIFLISYVYQQYESLNCLDLDKTNHTQYK